MKKIINSLIVLAMSLCLCGIFVAPAMAEEGVVRCNSDEQCDNGLMDYCTSIPKCQSNNNFDGVCKFIDPCTQFELVCDQLSEFNDERACMECVVDSDCPGQRSACGGELQFNGACIDNECVECIDDDDCNLAPIDECNTGIDPEADMECIDGVCIECVEDEECPEGKLCRDNICCGIEIKQECYPEDNQAWNTSRPGFNPACLNDADSDTEFCDVYGTCLTDGTCDNASNQCKPLGQFCVVADEKCAWCLEDIDCDGWQCDTYPEGYPNAGESILETSGPICKGNADCKECNLDSDCAAKDSFCTGTWFCDDSGCVQDNESYNPCSAEEEKTVCDDVNNICVVCTPGLFGDTSNCDEETFGNKCNETITCTDENLCDYGHTCASGQCLREAQKCYDCEADADCTEEKFPGRAGVCVIGQDDVVGSDNDTNFCAECQFDKDCPGVCKINVIDDPKDNRCVDCRVDNDCEGTDVCTDNNECVECFGTNCPCPDGTYCLEDNPFPECVLPKDFELNVCVECRRDNDCPAGVCDLGDCPDCVPQVDALCGELIEGCQDDFDCRTEGVGIDICVEAPCDRPNFCCEPQESTLRNVCKECLEDSHCDVLLGKLDDPLAACKVDAKCDTVTNTCSYSDPCGELECYPAGYYNSDDFGKTTFIECDGDNCSAVEYYCAACANDAACMDDVFCNGVESCDKNGGCQAGVSPCADGQLCEEATDSCLDVECIEDTDCMFFETCNAENECAEIPATCTLKISPKKIKAEKLAEKGVKFRIKADKKGGAGFVANAAAYFGPQLLEVGAADINKKQTKRTSICEAIPGSIFTSGETLTIRIGDCEGTVEIK